MEERYTNEKAFPLKKRRLSVPSFNQEENNEQNAKHYADIDGEKIVEEDKKDMGIQVSNPISLIAIAASWLADAEENQEITARIEIKPIPQAYAVKSASEESDDDEKEAEVSKKNERKRFTKSRTSISRKPRTFYTPLTKLFKEDKEEQEEDVNDDLYSKVKRRRGRMALTEGGSRCSRVNGKRWRCSQLTRAGYALCDHHLGRQESLRHIGNLGSSTEPKKRAGRKKHKKVKVRSMKRILKPCVAICKW